MHRHGTLPVFVISALLTMPTLAQTQWTIFTGLEQRNNITRDVDDPIDDNVAIVGSDLSYQNKQLFHEINLSYSAAREEYLDDSFEPRNQLIGSGFLAIKNRTDSFSWEFEDREQDGVLDVLQAEVPDNLTRISTLRTGPTAKIRASQRDNFILAANYIKVNTRNAVADNESITANMEWQHFISRKSQLSGILSRIETDVDQTELDTITQDRGTLAFYRTIKDGLINLELGYSDSDAIALDGEEVSGTPEYNFSIDKTTDIGRFLLQTRKELASTGLDSTSLISDNITDAGSFIFRLEVLTLSGFNYDMDVIPDRLSFRLNALTSRRESQLDTRIVDSDSAGIGMGVRIEKFNLAFGVQQINDQVETIGNLSEQDRIRYSVNISRPLGQKFNLRCAYELERFENPGQVDEVESDSAGCFFSYIVF